MTLYIDSPKTKLEVKNNGVLVSNETDQQLFMPNKIGHIILGDKIMVSTDVLILAAKNQIPVFIEDSFGHVSAVIRSPEYTLDADIRKSQILFIENTAKKTIWAKWLFEQKIKNQITLLKYIADRKPRISITVNLKISILETNINKIAALHTLDFEDFRASVLGIEGTSARTYWDIISEALPTNWQFEARSRQPAKDAFNASINYLYGMLYSEIENTIYLAGLDAHQGVFHAEQYQKPVLAYDIIELFRMWADKVLIELIWNETLKLEHYDLSENGVTILKEGKGVLIPAFKKLMYERKMYIGRNAQVQEHFRIAVEHLKSQF